MENNTNQSGGRSSGTQNRNRSRNRNRNRNNGGGNQNRNRNKGGGQGNSNNRNRNRNRNRKPKVIELTLTQKIIKAITFGAVDPNNKNKKSSKPQAKKQDNHSSGHQAKKESAKPKSAKPAREPKVYEVTTPRLYVGNLDYNAAESDLEDLFRGVGNVIEAEVVTNSRTQQSKGFAFVEMGSLEEAKRAVEVLHDQDFMGRKLLVSGAKSEGPRNTEEKSADEEAA